MVTNDTQIFTNGTVVSLTTVQFVNICGSSFVNICGKFLFHILSVAMQYIGHLLKQSYDFCG